MNTALKWLAATILTAAAATSALAAPGDMALGVAGDASAVTREVVITPQTRWINVDSGETVRLVDSAGGKAVIWRFDTPSWAVGALTDFAPDLAQGRQIRVYVAEPMLYVSDI